MSPSYHQSAYWYRMVYNSYPLSHISCAVRGDPAAEQDTQAGAPAINTQVVQEGSHSAYVSGCIGLCALLHCLLHHVLTRRYYISLPMWSAVTVVYPLSALDIGAAAAFEAAGGDVGSSRFGGTTSLAFQGGTFERLMQRCSGEPAMHPSCCRHSIRLLIMVLYIYIHI